jgi:hypothetical protein
MGAHPKLANRRVQSPPRHSCAMVWASAAGGWHRHTQWMRRLWQCHGLSLTLFELFLLFALGQSVVGHWHYNAEQQADRH